MQPDFSSRHDIVASSGALKIVFPPPAAPASSNVTEDAEGTGQNGTLRDIPSDDLLIDFTLEGLLGRGSFKEVRRATWKEQAVAALLMHGGVPFTQMEMDVLGRLGNHVRLLRFHGVSRSVQNEVTRDVMVAELAPLGGLAGHLDDNGEDMLLQVKLAVVEQVAEACEQLALEGIVHGDIAARNVLVFECANDDATKVRVKLGDYGQSRFGNGYMTAGTPLPVRHSAPEVIRKRKFSEASDVWAWGVFVWEVFSDGDVPFWESNTDHEVIQRVVGGGRLPQPEGCPDRIYSLLQKCWEKNHRQRPTFSQLRTELRAVAMESGNVGLCVVCHEAPASAVLAPCGHACCCVADARRLGDRCPICRVAIESVVERVFQS